MTTHGVHPFPCATHSPTRLRRLGRDCIKRTLDDKGLPYLGELCLANCRDLARLIQWNAEQGIRLFRCRQDERRVGVGSRGDGWGRGGFCCASTHRHKALQLDFLALWPCLVAASPPQQPSPTWHAPCRALPLPPAHMARHDGAININTTPAASTPFGHACWALCCAVLCRISSVLFPWMGTFKAEELPNYEEVRAALRILRIRSRVHTCTPAGVARALLADCLCTSASVPCI